MHFLQQHWDAVLFFTFLAHLLPFCWLAWRRRSVRQYRVVGIFALLVLHRGLRWSAVDTTIFGMDWAWLLRLGALVLLGMSVVDWWRRRRNQRMDGVIQSD